MSDDAVRRPQFHLLSGTSGWGVRSALVPDALLGFALSMVIFYPALVAHIHASMTPLIAVVLLVWTNGMLERPELGERARPIVALVASYAVAMVIVARLLARADGNAPASTLEELALLLPLAAAAGWVLVRTGRITQYLSWLLATGVVTVLPAIYERLASVSLIHPHALVRAGHTRAIVGTDHPLVLGTLLLALIPIAMYLGGRWRVILAVWLYVGVLTTGSNGPELVGAFLLALCVLPFLARAVLSTARPLLVLVAATGAYLFVGAMWLWTAQIPGTSSVDASNQYRAALYYLTRRILHDRPFGYGLDGLPPDTYYVSTAGSGIRDIGTSIDSELVFAVTQIGYFALVAFVVIAIVGARAAPRNHAIGLSSLATTLVGLFLAIHSWNSLGTFWFFGIGACAALVTGYDGSLDWTGLYKSRRVSGRQAEEAEEADEPASVGVT